MKYNRLGIFTTLLLIELMILVIIHSLWIRVNGYFTWHFFVILISLSLYIIIGTKIDKYIQQSQERCKR